MSGNLDEETLRTLVKAIESAVEKKSAPPEGRGEHTRALIIISSIALSGLGSSLIVGAQLTIEVNRIVQEAPVCTPEQARKQLFEWLKEEVDDG